MSNCLQVSKEAQTSREKAYKLRWYEFLLFSAENLLSVEEITIQLFAFVKFCVPKHHL